MAKSLDELTESDFRAYERVRGSGKWNMFDRRAEYASGLDKDTYLGVLGNYKALMERFPDVSQHNLGTACDQVVDRPTMEHWYCGNPPKRIVNGRSLCTFHANRLRN